MNLKDTINIIDFAIKYYRDENFNRRFGLLEYYSITDISPKQLAKLAHKAKMSSQGVAILNFSEAHYWQQKEIDIQARLRNYHSFNGMELTNDDKLTIVEKITNEGYPLLEGIYDKTAFYYANKYEFTKESIREKIMDTYNHKNARSQSESKKAKVLKK